MKNLILAAALLLSVSMAHATYCKDGSLIASHPNGDCSKPIPTPVPPTPAPTTPSSNAAATAAAAANSSAASKSASTSQAAGGNASAAGGKSDASSSASGGTANGSQQLSGVGNDSISSNYKAIAVALPPPAITPPSPNITCPDTGATTVYLGWGAASWSTRPPQSGCEFRLARKDLHDSCQYDSERLVQLKYLQELGVGRAPTQSAGKDKNYVSMDLTPDECALKHEIEARALQPVTYVTNNFSNPDYRIVDQPIPKATPEQATCVQPVAAKSKPKPKGKKVASIITECKVN